MATVIIMPKLGFNMSEGQLVKWCKAEGETVQTGEVLFEINTDKTTMPVEATSDGTVLKLLIEEGDYADVFTPIAVVGQPGEDVGAALAAYAGGSGEEAAEVKDVSEQAGAESSVAAAAPAAVTEGLKLTPRARKYIKEHDIDIESLAGITGTGYRGGICEKDIKMSPLARKVARKLGVDVSAVAGTGPQGKVMKEDVLQAAQAPADAGSREWQILKEVPYKGVRKIIGDRLSQSKFTAPHLYFTDEIDTTNLTAFRKKLNETADEKISISALLVLACSKALQKYPAVNSSLKDDKIVMYKSTNIGIAVAGGNGLVVPVVRNAQEKNLTTIAAEADALVAKAREGRLESHEMGGTFTFSNLGMFGIDNFTAIINPPEAAILSVSSVRKKAVVVTENGEDVIAVRPMMNIQLSADHRIIDGLLAAQFVGYLKELLENPIRIVI